MAFLIPVPGRTVLMPGHNLPLPSEGRDLPFTAFWQQRLHAGDVVLGTPPQENHDSTAPSTVELPPETKKPAHGETRRK